MRLVVFLATLFADFSAARAQMIPYAVSTEGPVALTGEQISNACLVRVLFLAHPIQFLFGCFTFGTLLSDLVSHSSAFFRAAGAKEPRVDPHVSHESLFTLRVVQPTRRTRVFTEWVLVRRPRLFSRLWCMCVCFFVLRAVMGSACVWGIYTQSPIC